MQLWHTPSHYFQFPKSCSTKSSPLQLCTCSLATANYSLVRVLTSLLNGDFTTDTKWSCARNSTSFFPKQIGSRR